MTSLYFDFSSLVILIVVIFCSRFKMIAKRYWIAIEKTLIEIKYYYYHYYHDHYRYRYRYRYRYHSYAKPLLMSKNINNDAMWWSLTITKAYKGAFFLLHLRSGHFSNTKRGLDSRYVKQWNNINYLLHD